jgi:hypothetical protein
MKKINPEIIFVIGRNSERINQGLAIIETVTNKKNAVEFLKYIIDNLSAFVKQIDILELKYIPKYDKIQNMITSCQSSLQIRKETKIVKKTSELREEFGSVFPEFLSHLQVVFKMDAFLYHQNFNLNISKLKKGPKEFIDESKWDQLDSREKEDLADAVRCILCEIWTPGGMMLMRFAESLVRKYSEQVTTIQTDDVWGRVISDLESDPNSDRIFLGYLKYLKEIRNKLQHPDERFNQSDTEQMFMHIVHIIDKIY